MITFTVKHKGSDFQERLPDAIREGLIRVGKVVVKNSNKYLKGRGSKKSKVEPGKYPVPIRTANLKQSLNYANPGTTVTIGKKQESVSDDTILIFNSARYAVYIHEGTGTSSKYGKRPYLTDGYNDTDVLKEFDKGFSNEIHE